ncbi:alpha/beta hydrolase [Stagnihabitans tardus]|uniref:Alpha/beta fold hydrolase n=1 Tax=Stagnihabitans tardus TaxID=2699202 RepID=A0AAE4Y9S0_9RHOB|nr:alpha/beta hydrolase [Stagnihabitans tardus]NBZ86354.1 alpha/beta fold hydrolase [Stagnihabitans tardus]
MSDRDSLDRAYANSAHIPGGADYPARWDREARAFRATARSELGLAYGSGEGQALDLFLPAQAPRGLVVFIHGGYWIEGGREYWSHLAAGAVARGWAMALPSYTLAPKARIAQMTAEVAQAVATARARVPGPVVVTGHSAGGHLAARMACLSALERVVPISPLADLGPIAGTSMNDLLHLDAAEIAAESPCLSRPLAPAHVWVGAQERPAFLWQARLLSEAWACPWTPEPGRHHFDIVEGLCDPASPLMQTLIPAA